MSTASARPLALLADDYPLIRCLVGEYLRIGGYDVIACSDGHEALSAFCIHRFHLVVMDIRMPRKTGIEVLHEIRARGDRVPAVIMSSFLGQELETLVGTLDRVVLLEKPFGTEEFLAAVTQAVRSVRC